MLVIAQLTNLFTRTNPVRGSSLKRISQEGARTALSMIDIGKYVLFSQAGHMHHAGLSGAVLSYPFIKYVPQRIAGEIAKYLPVVSLPLALLDAKNGFTCFQLPIDARTRNKAEAARDLVAGALRRYGYEGWSNEIDRRYDPYSHYFVVQNNEGEIVATSRLTHRTEQNFIPFENGFKRNGSQYGLESSTQKIIDINSFYYKKGNARALPLLFSTMARYAMLIGVERVFCMLDMQNEKIKEIYLRAGFRFSDRFVQQIYFPTFGRIKEDGFQPTFWRIMEMGLGPVLLHAFNSIRYRPANNPFPMK